MESVWQLELVTGGPGGLGVHRLTFHVFILLAGGSRQGGTTGFLPALHSPGPSGDTGQRLLIKGLGWRESKC